MQFAIALLLFPVPCLLSPLFAQEDPFAAGVRTTPWLSPADEQKAFQLPPGFEINLVAAEPDIQKPLNMAFDERGRIWLTCTVEYPYAAPLDKPGRDSIRVLEDTGGDGRYEKVHTFADGLNIPIGIYPYKGGCIAWSIPNIWHFEDTDQDGVCDKRTVLYGPFDHTRDVHGNCNAFRRGFDGWIYACHGFNNDSHVKGKDGHEVHLNSGNTFRFKIDGSRIEHFTHGQVNPFGMCFDELFNIFTADCHSKPLTQLIRGGYYPSFGKGHDGLGFVPSMMEHSHGSTAICGVVKYSGENFPKEYQGDFLSGNVMTSRINRNQPEYHGSTIKAIEQPDFLSTADPWFRPVDLQIGPDGALYILDFYNRIIGHYEVPLPHPGRDRTSGRIWRVVYKGTGDRGQGTEVRAQRSEGRENSAVGNALRGVPGGGDDAPFKPDSTKPGEFDLTNMTVEQLIEQLDSPQLEHRLRVLNYLADVEGSKCLASVQACLKSPHSPHQQIAAMWILERLEALPTSERVSLLGAASRDARVHALKLGSERLAYQPEDRDAAVAALRGPDSCVARAGAEALALHDSDSFAALLEAWKKAPRDDGHLNYGIRMAIRRNFAAALSPGGSGFESLVGLPDEQQRQLAQIASATSDERAAMWLAGHLQEHAEPDDVVVSYVTHIVKHAPSLHAAQQDFVAWAQQRSAGNLALASKLIQALGESESKEVQSKIRPWANEVAGTLLERPDSESIGWTAVPVEGKPPSESPWVIGSRQQGDGQNDHPLFYSLPKGEQRTGIYRSGTFELPEKLSFWCCGHSGYPGKPLTDGNYVRLRDAETHEILAESRPPRNDVARKFEWDLSKYVNTEPAKPSPQPSPKGRGGQSGEPRRGYIELVDGDEGDAYAWLAVGRFSLPALNSSDTAKKQQLAAEIVGKLKLTALRPRLAELVAAPNTDGAARAAIGQALLSFEPSATSAALVAALNEPSIPSDLRVAIGATLARSASEGNAAQVADNLRAVMKVSPARLQTTIADTLAGDAAGGEALLALVESGHASPRLLLAPNVSTKVGTLNDKDLASRVAAATSRLPPVSETLDKLILERRLSFTKATPNLEKGQAVFIKHCAGCHQVAGKGSVVGPQLDGIGGRGLERIIEDILDPNRNVDIAFRTTSLRLTDGRVVSGLLRREEGAQLVLADNTGKEFTVAREEIDQQAKTSLSLMPANVPEIVPAEEFYDLLGWLLAQKPAANKQGN